MIMKKHQQDECNHTHQTLKSNLKTLIDNQIFDDASNDKMNSTLFQTTLSVMNSLSLSELKNNDEMQKASDDTDSDEMIKINN